SHALSPLDVPAEVCSGSGSRTGTARARKQICWKAVAFRVLPWVGGAVAGALLVWLLWSPGVVEKEKVVEVPVPGAHPAAAAESGPEPKAVLRGDSGPVWALSFLGGDRLVVGAEDGSIKV